VRLDFLTELLCFGMECLQLLPLCFVSRDGTGLIWGPPFTLDACAERPAPLAGCLGSPPYMLLGLLMGCCSAQPPCLPYNL
jgi:hypothetical protein